MDAVADLWPMTTAERGDGKSSVGKVRHRFVGHEQQETDRRLSGLGEKG